MIEREYIELQEARTELSSALQYNGLHYATMIRLQDAIDCIDRACIGYKAKSRPQGHKIPSGYSTTIGRT